MFDCSEAESVERPRITVFATVNQVKIVQIIRNVTLKLRVYRFDYLLSARMWLCENTCALYAFELHVDILHLKRLGLFEQNAFD